MTEHPTNQFESKDDERELKRETMIVLARELSERTERIPFPGIDPDAYSKMRATDEEFPGYTTPIDELIERFKSEGMKVVPGKYAESGTVYIVPSQSDNVEDRYVIPRQLQVTEVMDEKLKKLILMGREFYIFDRSA